MDVARSLLIVLLTLALHAAQTRCTAVVNPDQQDVSRFALNNVIICDEDRHLESGFPVPLDTQTQPAGSDVDGVNLSPDPLIPLISKHFQDQSQPSLDLDTMILLLDLLGDDLNMTLQATSIRRSSDGTIVEPLPANPCDTNQDSTPLSARNIRELIDRRAQEEEVIISTDILESIEQVFTVLSCYIKSAWADAGPTYFPRYFVGTNCIRRPCSVPDQEMFCQPDFEKVMLLTAFRTDCCFVTEAPGLTPRFLCGWRKVTFPLACNCKCACE